MFHILGGVYEFMERDTQGIYELVFASLAWNVYEVVVAEDPLNCQSKEVLQQ